MLILFENALEWNFARRVTFLRSELSSHFNASLRKGSTIQLSIFPEGPAPSVVPDLWRLRLHSVPDVPWQQDVRVPQLLHGFLQSPQVHFLQRERPAALCELHQVRVLSA